MVYQSRIPVWVPSLKLVQSGSKNSRSRQRNSAHYVAERGAKKHASSMLETREDHVEEFLPDRRLDMARNSMPMARSMSSHRTIISGR